MNSGYPIQNGLAQAQAASTVQMTSSPQVTDNIPPPQPTDNAAHPQKQKRSNTRKPSGAPKIKKVKTEPVANLDPSIAPQSQIGDHMPVQKKKRDRFKGMSPIHHDILLILYVTSYSLQPFFLPVSLPCFSMPLLLHFYFRNNRRRGAN